MGKIIVARHGESESNASGIVGGDSPLTPKGIRQANALVERIRIHTPEFRVDYVFSGPSKRGKQTAEILAHGLCASYLVIPSIVERHHGVLDGRHYSLIPTLAKEYVTLNDGKMYIVEAEGGENYFDLWVRAGAVLSDIRVFTSILSKNDTLVIGHAALNKAMRAVDDDLPWQSLLQHPSMDNGDFFVLAG